MAVYTVLESAGAAGGKKPSGGSSAKKFSAATRLARYQKRLLLTQQSRSFDENE